MNQTEEKVLQVPIEDILPNRFQPRLAFSDDALSDLAASIKQHGIIQPLVLRRIGEKYEIIAGERRYKAAKMAGLITVPAIISNMDDNTSAEVAIVENIQRKDLTAIEEAKSYQSLLDKGYMTQEELARKMGLSQSAISNKLRLLTLDDEVQDAVLNEKISERHARSLLKVADKALQRELLNKIINNRLTVKQLEDEIKNMLQDNEVKAEKVGPVLEKEPVVEETKPEEEEKLVEQGPSIADIINKSRDIKPVVNDTEELEIHENVDSNSFFSSPEKMPNKFFNFLEDEAVNMGMADLSTPVYKPLEPAEEQKTKDILGQTENIEMLDDFFAASSNPEAKSNDEYLNKVIETVRNLNFDSDKVKIEEMNLPAEYMITIKIKKEDPNKKVD